MTDKISNMLSTNFYMARSGSLLDVTTDTYNIIRIPQFAFVDEIWVKVITPYSGGTGASSSMTVGFVGNKETADPDAFIDSVANVETAGLYAMTDDAAVASNGKWFDSGSGILTITVNDGDHTALLDAIVFMRYCIIN